jgi:hypothetical protein
MPGSQGCGPPATWPPSSTGGSQRWQPNSLFGPQTVAELDATAEVVLADGNRASVGDVIITRANDRRLRLSATDWVKNGDRWTITRIGPRGDVTVRHTRSHLTVRLSTDYVRQSTGLGYATTIHSATASRRHSTSISIAAVFMSATSRPITWPPASVQARVRARIAVVLPAPAGMADTLSLDAAVQFAATESAWPTLRVSADTMRGLLTGQESRQQLYTMLTRGRHANHLYLQVVGDGDPHILIRPDTISPRTPSETLQQIVARDEAPVSAGAVLRELNDPAARLFQGR